LPVIAPLFLSLRKPGKQQKKYSIAEDIPDLFSGKGLAPAAKAAPAPAVSAAPIPAHAPMPAAPAPVAAVPVPKPAAVAPSPAPVPAAPSPASPAHPQAPSPATIPAPVAAAGPREIGDVLGQPGKSKWAPPEIVQRTCTLSGVAGALLVLPDGLMIAGQLPPHLNLEAVAAFTPQIFGRMTQYAKELKFPECRRLTLQLDGVSLRIYQLGRMFFTVLGRPDEPLPEADLAVVAAFLTHLK
jgi:predicted regulator of Ras-like GTPase activity (Roadblock/LC7/MglB family)